MRFSFLHRWAAGVFIFTAGACDYAKVETVQELERNVDSVRVEQRLLRNDVENTSKSTQVLQASVSAMGSGFNVLTETVTETDTRVDTLETEAKRLNREVKDVRDVARSASGGNGSRREPNSIGLYLGTRFNTKTLKSDAVRMRWCEAPEGVEGYLVETGVDPDYASLQCWRYADVAIFRQEAANGPRVMCLRDIDVGEDGGLLAMDCSEPILYNLNLR